MDAQSLASDERLFVLPDEAVTAALGAALASVARPGDVIALSGELGSGKTVLARGFITALAPPDASAEEVPSPTFSLVQCYERSPAPIWHFDLYRLEDPEELIELGLDEALAEGIALIEWPEHAGPYLPDERLDVRLENVGDKDVRRARLQGASSWRERLQSLRLDLEPSA